MVQPTQNQPYPSSSPISSAAPEKATGSSPQQEMFQTVHRVKDLQSRMLFGAGKIPSYGNTPPNPNASHLLQQVFNRVL